MDFLQRGCVERPEDLLRECRYEGSAVDIEFQVKPEDSVFPREGGRVSILPFPLQPYPQIQYERAFSAEKAYEVVLFWFMAGSQTVADTVRQWKYHLPPSPP